MSVDVTNEKNGSGLWVRCWRFCEPDGAGEPQRRGRSWSSTSRGQQWCTVAGGYAEVRPHAGGQPEQRLMVLPIQAVKSVETAEGSLKYVVFVHTDTRAQFKDAIDVVMLGSARRRAGQHQVIPFPDVRADHRRPY